MPAQIPIDIILFEKPFSSNALHFVQYAASLEINNYQNQSELSVADTLVLYKYMVSYIKQNICILRKDS